MIQRMEVFTSRQGAPELPLSPYSVSSNEDPIQLRDVTGLGPVAAQITTTPFANADGEIYQGATVGKRNIVLSLGLNPDWPNGQTIADLRQLLYAYFLPKQWVKLRIFVDHLPTTAAVDIEGYVETMDPNIFSKDPEMQISIICPRPDFIDSQPVLHNGNVGNFNVDIDDFELIYRGTVSTGFEVLVTVSGTPDYTGKLVITNKTPGIQRFVIDPVTISAEAAMQFRLSSIKSAKRAQNVMPDGTVQNLLRHVTTVTKWPVLVPGSNLFSVAADAPQGTPEAVIFRDMAWSLAYFPRYGAL